MTTKISPIPYFKPIKDNCLLCQEEYIRYSPRGKYCGKCRNKVKKFNSKRWQQRKKKS